MHINKTVTCLVHQGVPISRNLAALHVYTYYRSTTTQWALPTFGTAAWKRKFVIGVGVKLVAVRVMAVTEGLLGLRSKLNWILRPAFSKAVMGGIPKERRGCIT